LRGDEVRDQVGIGIVIMQRKPGKRRREVMTKPRA
jgi:hypothetical protein